MELRTGEPPRRDESALKSCPYCHGKGVLSINEIILNQMSRRQRIIYMTVFSAGTDGISPMHLMQIIWKGVAIPISGPGVMRVAIHGVNRIIREYGEIIKGSRSTGYQLLKINEA